MCPRIGTLLVLAALLAACAGEQPVSGDQEQPEASGRQKVAAAPHAGHERAAAELRTALRKSEVAKGTWRRMPRIEGVNREWPENLRAVVAGERAVVIAGQVWPNNEDPNERHEARNAIGGVSLAPDGTDGRLLPQPSVRRPAPHTGYSAVSDGRRVYVWGGSDARIGDAEYGGLASGAAYDALADRWRRLPMAPFGADAHAAVWAEEEMLVSGGIVAERCVPRPGGDGTCDFRQRATRRGAAYDPSSRTWRAIAPSPLAPRGNATAVWTGEEMIVWGGWLFTGGRGSDAVEVFTDGAAYDPSTDSWRAIPAAPLTGGRSRRPNLPRSVWSGSEMIVWDGREGASYSPRSNSWQPIAPSPLRSRVDSATVWTGQRMVLWAKNGGALYDLRKDAWELLPETSLARADYPAVLWTDVGLVVWGNRSASEPSFAGAIFSPAQGA